MIDVKGEVISSLGPLPSPAKRLGWSAGREGNPSSLVALTSEGCYVWASVGEAPSLSIPCQTGDASSLLATTPQSSIVATSCIASCVCCWDLFSLLEARTDAEAEVPPPTMLNEYERQVSCLAWDAEGRYLATSDGADCTVW